MASPFPTLPWPFIMVARGTYGWIVYSPTGNRSIEYKEAASDIDVLDVVQDSMDRLTSGTAHIMNVRTEFSQDSGLKTINIELSIAFSP